MRPTTALALVSLAAGAACSGKSKTTTQPATPAGGAASVGQGSAAPVTSPYPTQPTGPATAPVPAAPGVKVTLGDVGLEQSALDRTVDPCIDFYQFACGGWLAANPIPPDHARWSRFQEIQERNRAQLEALLEEAAKGIGADATTKQLGDFYAACMDEPGAERTALASLAPVLGKARITNLRGWMPAIAKLHEHGIWVVWRSETAADLKDAANHALYLDTAGLGLDRDLYLDPRAKPQLDAYRAYVARLLALGGTPVAKADAAAADVIAIETELARVARTANDGSDERKLYNPVDVKTLARQARGVDWKAYWKLFGVTPAKQVIVKAPRLFAGLDRLRAKFRPAQWTSYFTFHVLDDTALALGKPGAEALFEREKITAAIEKAPARSKRCIAATQAALGDLLARQYVGKYVPGQAKQTATALATAVAAALADQLARVDWMSPPTRDTALAKLQRVVRQIGFPERWRSYDLEVRRDDLAGNLLRARAFETRRSLARWGKPVDRGEWQLPAYAIEPYYDHRSNTATLPAGVLQPPFFGPDRAVAANLGGVGALFGRELAKGFDDLGGQFDGDGNLRPWWTKDDLAKFDARAKCVETQYAQYEALPKGFVDGKLTLAENIADHTGVVLAFKAYRALRKDAPKVYVADGYTEDQQFFIAVGQAWCTRDRPAELAKRLVSDPHAPPKFRVYGSLRNMKEFTEAFACAPGTPMNPAKSCSVW